MLARLLDRLAQCKWLCHIRWEGPLTTDSEPETPTWDGQARLWEDGPTY